MDKQTMAKLANSVNDVVAATSKPLNLEIAKLKAENEKLKKTIKLTGITLSRKEDGHWLSFESSKGNSACLRIESLEDKFGYITWKAIMEWAEEQPLI